jgi:hypothetical protein
MGVAAPEKVIIKDIPAVRYRQFAERSALASPHAAKPAAIRASPACNDIAFFQVHAGRKTFSALAGSGTTNLGRGKYTPFLIKPLGFRHIPRKGYGDMYPVRRFYLGEKVGAADVSKIICRRCFCPAREYTHYPHTEPSPLHPIKQFILFINRVSLFQITFLDKTAGLYQLFHHTSSNLLTFFFIKFIPETTNISSNISSK